MTDHLNEKRRSWNMSRIRSKHSKPEIIIRSLLHRAGYRFRKNYKKLPGTPDIVLPKYRIVIFVHGCFWHRHKNCTKASTPKTNTDYWIKKFKKNVSRDIQVKEDLKNLEWKVLTFWECQIIKDPIDILNQITNKIPRQVSKFYSIGLNRSEILKFASKKSNYLKKIKS